jgi:hypothetical protein
MILRGCRSLSSAVALLLLAACSSEPPPAPAAPPPAPAPAPVAEPAATGEPAPADTGNADAGAPPAQTGSGRPPIIKSDPVEITDTFGSTPAARLELGGERELATLRIPEGALATAANVTFKLDAKAKGGGGLVGKVYRITLIVPPAPTATRMASSGPPFQLKLPAGNKKDANLAIGEITVDAKGKEKVAWSVVPALKVDDASGVAEFELTSLGDSWLHVTTKPPSGGAAPAAK